jgi:hypothetical protein
VPLSEVYSEPFPDLGDPRIKACLRLPEAYRSLTTSFIGSWCQGILTCTFLSLTKFTLEIVYSTRRSHPIVKELHHHARTRTQRPRNIGSHRLPLVGHPSIRSLRSSARRHRSRRPPRQAGDDRARTDDLLVANQALYQLSYVPGLASPTPERPTAPENG